MFIRKVSVAALAIFVASIVPADAQVTPASVTMDGDYRVRGFFLTHPDLEPDVQPNVQRYLQHRLRLQPHFFVNELISMHVQADAMDNQIWGANPGDLLTQSTEDRQPNAVLKRAHAEVRSQIGLFQVGRQASHWGMGMVDNDGLGFRNEFGDAFEGTTFDRIQFSTQPLGPETPLTLALMYDKIIESDVEDISAVRRQKGDVDQFGLSLLYDEGDLTAGFYGRYRSQSRTDTTMWIPDVYVAYDDGSFHASAEIAAFLGQTSSFVTFLSPGQTLVDGDVEQTVDNFTLAQPSVDLSAFGAVAEVGYRPMTTLDLALEFGFASGDDATQISDGTFSTFSFNRDYNVGLLMFQEANRFLTAQRLENLRNAFQTPGAVVPEARLDEFCLEPQQCVNATDLTDRQAMDDFLFQTAESLVPTHGAVRNAYYVFPKVRYQPFETLHTVLGVLWAQAPEDVETRVLADAADPLGPRETAKNYGFEVDLAVEYRYTENLRVGVQAGWFRPGDIFQRADASRAPSMFLVQPRFTVIF